MRFTDGSTFTPGLIVEDTATQAEKTARQRAALSLLIAPLSYFRAHMTGNIHGRLNRSLEGTVKLIKLMFMDFAPAVTTGLAAAVTIFPQLPVPVDASLAWRAVLVIPVGTFIVLRQIGRHAEGHPRGADGHQGGHGRRHGGAAGRH